MYVYSLKANSDVTFTILTSLRDLLRSRCLKTYWLMSHLCFTICSRMTLQLLSTRSSYIRVGLVLSPFADNYDLNKYDLTTCRSLQYWRKDSFAYISSETGSILAKLGKIGASVVGHDGATL